MQSIADSGAIPRWNESNPEKALAVNDIIVQVNEVAGTSRDMMNELKSSNAMALRVERRAARRHFSVDWVANKRFEISKFKFKIPRARTSELQGSFSAVSKPNFASKYSLESSRRDLHNALLCTVL